MSSPSVAYAKPDLQNPADSPKYAMPEVVVFKLFPAPEESLRFFHPKKAIARKYFDGFGHADVVPDFGSQDFNDCFGAPDPEQNASYTAHMSVE